LEIRVSGDMRIIIGIWISAFAVASAGLSDTPHPRLWFPTITEKAVHEKIARDPLAAQLQAIAMAEADRILNNIMHCA